MNNFLDDERLIPVGRPLHSKILNGGKRKEFFCGFCIQHSSAIYRWKVYIGDIVAISMADHSKNNDGCLSQQEIEEWHPDHLKKKSPHWKIGLVLGMAQIVDPQDMTNVKYECHVEWLEKALETSEFLKNKKLSQSYRPYTKETVKFKLPHVLLRSHRHASVSPANILPVQITMLTDADFKDGVLWDPVQRPEDRFSFKMHCPKFISSFQQETATAFQPDACMDSWPELNHYSFVKRSSKTIPKPLQQAWAKWAPIQHDDDLLMALMRGYENSSAGKAQEYRNFKNRQVDEQKQLAEEERLQLEAEETKRQAKRAASVSRHNKRSAEAEVDQVKNKRVRVSINGTTPVAGPTISKGNFRSNVKSILKTAVEGVKNKLKKPKAVAAKIVSSSVKTTSAVRLPVESTPSTKSMSSTASPPFHNMPNLNLSKKQLAMTVNTLGEKPIHNGMHQGDRCDFYERVTITSHREAQPRVIVVGHTVAVMKEDTGLPITAQAPFHVPWGVAQILAIFQSVETGVWIIQLRWLLRFVEASDSIQKQLGRKKFFDEAQGLLETMNVGISPIQAILPIEVDVASAKRGKMLKELPPRWDCKELLRLYFQCRYFQDEDYSIVLRNDWDAFSATSCNIRGPLSRCLQCMDLNYRVRDKYAQAVRDRPSEMEDDEEGESSAEDESIESLLVEPLAKEPIFERWGAKFHDGVRITIDKRSLHESFSPETSQWTLKVGYVVPIACEDDGATAKPKKNAGKRWFPFICSWSPAQIVSLYEDCSGRWKMQIRWFHRFEDLRDEQKERLMKMEKAHILFETECYSDVDVSCCLPGRIVLSSSVCDSWEVARSSISGLPVIPHFCSYICLDDEVDESPDWTNYDVLLSSCPKPLLRGMLLDPRNRKNKDWILMLARRYKKSLSMRGSDPEDQLLKRWEGNGLVSPHSNMNTLDFCPEHVIAKVGSVWHTHNRAGVKCTFTKSLSISVPIEYVAMPLKSIRNAKFLVNTLTIGDIVAFYSPDAGERTDHMTIKNLKYPWFPFRFSWCFGQVMAIYYEQSDETCLPLIQMRRFYRPSEVPLKLRAFMPPAEDAEMEEVFESDSFTSSIPANWILGPCELFLGKHERSCIGLAKKKMQPLLSCRCRFFYHEAYQRFQHIFTTGLTPEAWWRRLFSRGISLSTFLGRSADLQQLMLSACSENQETLDIRGLLGDTTASQLGARGELQTSNLSPLNFFANATLLPNWDDVVDADLHFDKRDRVLTSWELQIGSMVAVRNESALTQQTVLTFPYRVPWTPCQIIAIYSAGSSSVEDLCFEVAQMKYAATLCNGNEQDLLEVDPSQGVTTSTILSTDLLGPLVLIPRESQAVLDWDEVPRNIPFAAARGSKLSLNELKKSVLVDNSPTASAIMEALGSAHATPWLDHSQLITKNEPGENESTESRTHSRPLFVDISHLRVFYEECWLVAQVELFENWLNSTTSSDKHWRIRVGDIVLIHCDGPKKHPLKCNWGVAEVMAIWKDHENRDQLEKDVHSSGKNIKAKLKVEIRWFYGRSDVAGLSGVESERDSNEVFETDDTFVLDDLTTILAPASLYSDLDAAPPDHPKFLNLPIQSFLCRRFWSTNRRSLMPCGDSSGRESRARLYSQVIPTSFPCKIANESAVNEVHDRGNSESRTWAESVRQVIAKLSLKETSKGAYVRGETLIGRENELTQLLSFFRAAIRGLPGPGGVRSSIFLAGAPGVGKTACIRSAIARLHSEQTRGEIPPFNFIPLNGMEMRHPFEAYVKLWESLTGEKHVGSHEKACHRLEYHFTNPKSLASDDDRSATVVLLDEIDYLVTEKQSVLYNFFDWPKRAASVPGGRRLVVIGISNTLNLAEQLMPSVQSRVGSERIVFRAYGVAEATAILQKKITEASPDHGIFDNDAILFAAKKTAAMSGDIRKAFQICRGAAELLLRRNDEIQKENPPNKQRTVRISDVQKASRESFDSALVSAVSFSTPFQALLLVSLASLCRSTGREVGGFDLTDIMTKMAALSGSCGDPEYAPPPAFGETLLLLNRLAETNLIKVCTASSSSVSFRSLGGGSGGAWPMTTLTVDEHTIARGLKGTPHQKLAEKFLPSQY